MGTWRARKVIVDFDDGELWVMDEDGNIETFRDPVAVVRSVRRADAKAAKADVSSVTTIEWRNMPDGFVPPEL